MDIDCQASRKEYVQISKYVYPFLCSAHDKKRIISLKPLNIHNVLKTIHTQACIRSCIRPFSTSHLSTRRQLLQEVYASAFKDLDTTSPEYQSLAKSGLVWENYFRPQNLEPYLAAQLQLQSQLDEVDGQIRLLGNNIHPTMTKEKVTYRLASEYAHQSTAIEGNALPVKAAMIIEAKLEEQLFSSLNNLADMSTRDLSVLPLPLSEELLPDEDPEMVSEVRNHLVVSRFLTSVALAKPGTTGVSLESIKDLSRIMLVGTAAEKLYQNSWGRRIKLGDYRSTPITTRTSPLRIFPYPVEVPACMERYIKWRDETHALSKLHPLIMAAQFFTYFVHIHPFADGNGRIGRA